MLPILSFLWAFTALASANHAHHHSMHHQHKESVSSFSHKLPGINSFMSVTRYFGAEANNATIPESVRTTSGQQDYFDPWNPRFQIPRVEASDEEWEELLNEQFAESGLLGGQILTRAPKGMINLNYDIHVCVHMGTELTPENSAYPPSALSYPEDGESAQKLHTLVMVDVSMDNKLHWLVVNIPGAKVNRGQVIAAYAGPNPAPGSGLHTYVMVVMEQRSEIDPDSMQQFKSGSSCEQANRLGFDLQAFRKAYALSEPVAANYFLEQYGEFVDNINSHCLKDAPLPAHPLYK